MRTLVHEEKILPLLLRHLDSSPAGSAKNAILRETVAMVGHPLPLPKRGIRILAIDGGGIKAVMSVLLLKRLQEECGGRPIQVESVRWREIDGGRAERKGERRKERKTKKGTLRDRKTKAHRKIEKQWQTERQKQTDRVTERLKGKKIGRKRQR